MSHKNQKSKLEVRNSKNAKRKPVLKKKKQTYSEIVIAKIDDRINFSNLNKMALYSYNVEKNPSKTLNSLKLKFSLLQNVFINDRGLEENICQGGEKYYKQFIESLETIYQVRVLQAKSLYEQAEVMEELGKGNRLSIEAYKLYEKVHDHLDLKTFDFFEKQFGKDACDQKFKQWIQLQLMSVYKIAKLVFGAKGYEQAKIISEGGLKTCESNALLMKNEKIEIFHKTIDLNDVWLKLISAYCVSYERKTKAENPLLKRLIRHAANSKFVTLLARKAFA